MKTYYVTFNHNGEKYAVACEDAFEANVARSSAKYCFGNVSLKKRISKDEKLMTAEEFDAITDEIIYSK